jgi:methylamine dehydrogenase accessory protein MauD
MIEVLAVSQALSWAVVLGLAVVVFSLARQIGVLHERVAPMGALMTDRVLNVGDRAPELNVPDIRGQSFHLGGKREDGRSQLLLLVAPNCPVCKKLLPTAKSFAKSERDRAELVLVGDGDQPTQEQFVKREGLESLPFVITSEIGMRFQVGKLPYAVLIDAEGTIRAKGLVNSREHLESLLVAWETGYASIQDYLRAQGG